MHDLPEAGVLPAEKPGVRSHRGKSINPDVHAEREAAEDPAPETTTPSPVGSNSMHRQLSFGPMLCIHFPEDQARSTCRPDIPGIFTFRQTVLAHIS